MYDKIEKSILRGCYLYCIMARRAVTLLLMIERTGLQVVLMVYSHVFLVVLIRLNLILIIKFIYTNNGSFLLHSCVSSLLFIRQFINLSSTCAIIEDGIDFLQAFAFGLNKPLPHDKESHQIPGCIEEICCPTNGFE